MVWSVGNEKLNLLHVENSAGLCSGSYVSISEHHNLHTHTPCVTSARPETHNMAKLTAC